MAKRRWFWTLCRVLTLLLFAGIVLAGYAMKHLIVGWCALAALLALHAAELHTSLSLQATAGLRRPYIIAMTLLFGFTWWFPALSTGSSWDGTRGWPRSRPRGQ
ncbi:MAG: hypothetical protein ACPL2N_03800 [Candidatus Cryosericum sp.]